MIFLSVISNLMRGGEDVMIWVIGLYFDSDSFIVSMFILFFCWNIEFMLEKLVLSNINFCDGFGARIFEYLLIARNILLFKDIQN